MRIQLYPLPTILLQETPTSFEPGSPEDRIVRFIQKYEAASKGYDAVWLKNKHPLPRKPTEMTVCEVRDWQLEARKVQKSTAIGAYQIVGDTYRRTLSDLGLDCSVLFDKATQDRFGLALLYGRGWPQFVDGTMRVEDFAFELAGEWAAFPAPYGKHKGFSRYRHIAGNKHQVSLSTYMKFLMSLRDDAKTQSVVAAPLHNTPSDSALSQPPLLVVQIDEPSPTIDQLQDLN